MENTASSLLVVDDDPGLRELLSEYLAKEGYQVATVEDGRAMDAWLEQHTPGLILLDIMLPEEDGLSIARRLRAQGNIPIIMLSARGEDIDRIIGLEVGADDYLAKPFNPRELLARIRAVLRRGSGEAENSTNDQDNKLRGADFGPYHLDLETQRLTCEGEEVPLTTGEFDLLRIFVENPNRVLSRDRLLDLLKGYERSPFDRSVDVQVARLRGKIERDSKTPRYIRTVWGKGYLFAPTGNDP